MEVLKENHLELAVCESFQDLLDSQKVLFDSQVDKLHNIVLTQCKLTGVNPLAQEMAAGALSIKIGKRPRDLLNPKAVKYMQSVFSIKDEITKKESREVSALLGVTVTQVREYFTSQRSRVRKLIRSSREKALSSNESKEVQYGVPVSTDPTMQIYPVPLNSMVPAGSEEEPSCSTQDESLPDLDDADRYFVENIFTLMRKEETFAGQVKLMEWILQIQNSSVLYWFLAKGGVMILATWLSQAACEGQTSVLHVMIKVLCHLPLHKDLPEHLSAILQSVNRLRFYRASDISNRARLQLSRWIKMFDKSQAMKKPNAVKSDTQNEMLLKQSISEIIDDESWESKLDVPEDGLAPFEGLENYRKLESPQPLKLLTATVDDPSKKLIRGVSSSQTRERRKVLLVEQPGQKPVGRSLQFARSVTSSQGRPLSADDIQKAKMRAQFMQSKRGKPGPSSGEGRQVAAEGHRVVTEGPTKVSFSQARTFLSASKAHVQPKVEEHKDPVMSPPKVEEPKDTVKSPPKVSFQQEAPLGSKMSLDVDEPLWKKLKRVKVPWQTPAETRIQDDWSVGMGENSKEVEVQRNRIHREKETVYMSFHEIPSDPKEPWDREMEYDDSLTPEIPTEQQPDAEAVETEVSPQPNEITAVLAEASVPSQSSNGSMPEPDLELLAVLLKNPELVFALTSGQSGSLPSEQTVKLLDMIKANGAASLGNLTGLGRTADENLPVSLPSPTPSSEPVTRGWRQEVSKNPFSRQSGAASGEAIATSEAAVSFPSREKVAARNFVRPELPPINLLAQQPVIISTLSQQPIPHYMLPDKGPPPLNSPFRQSASTGSPNMHVPPSETVLNMRTSSLNGSPALPSMRVETSVYVQPAPLSITVNIPERQADPFPATSLLPASTMPQRQQLPPEPLHPTHSWRATQGLALNPYRQPHQNEYNSFVGGPVQPGPPPRAGFESWSPENSPSRSTEYMYGPDYREPRMSVDHNHMPGPGPSGPDRSRPWSSSGYRDNSRHGNRRWRDERR